MVVRQKIATDGVSSSPGIKPSALPIAEKLEKKIKRGKDALKHWENLVPLLREIIAEHNGELPGDGWFKKNSHSGIAAAILRHHGGFFAVRKKLGLKQLIRSGEDSLKHWGNLEALLQKIIAENNGVLPRSKWLNENHSDIMNAVRTYYGGIYAVRKKLGLEKRYKYNEDSLKHWANLKRILQKIIAENNDQLPGGLWFEKNNLSSIKRAILIYHGGFSATRVRLGLTPVRKRGEYTLGHWANIEPRLCEIIAKNNGILPGSKWLIKNGYADLNTAIIRHHGGFATVRDKLRTFGILKDQPSSNEIFQQLKDAMDGSDGPLP